MYKPVLILFLYEHIAAEEMHFVIFNKSFSLLQWIFIFFSVDSKNQEQLDDILHFHHIYIDGRFKLHELSQCKLIASGEANVY